LYRRLKNIAGKIYFTYLLSLVWTLIILYLSLGKIPDNEQLKINIPHLDKVVHLTMYFIYTSLLLIENKKQKKSTTVLIVLYTVLFGATMEILQYSLFTYRSGDFYDLLFNVLGVLLSLLLIKKLKKIITTLFPQNQQLHP
jgi:VanZ family protein